MTERVQAKAPKPEMAALAEEDAVRQAAQQTAHETGEKLKSDLDSIIDEIEEVLCDNAEEMVKDYVQKGGE